MLKRGKAKKRAGTANREIKNMKEARKILRLTESITVPLVLYLSPTNALLRYQNVYIYVSVLVLTF